MLRHSATTRLSGLALVLLGLVGSFLAAVAVLLAWRAEFVVENRSGETIEVSPIGVLEASGGRRSALRLQHGGRLPALDRGAFRMAPGDVRRFAYDWDDINLSELAVRRQDGPWHSIVLRPGADTSRCCSTLAMEHVIVPMLATLPVAPEAVARAAETTRYNLRELWVYLWCLGPLAVAIGAWLLFRGRSPSVLARRESRAATLASEA